jgi:small neutral amino acid transporter SnatA (MarC family)
MLLGFLLPLLRRFTARTRMLIAAAIMTAGVALALALALHGHAHRENALPIRLCVLLALAGLGLLVSGARASRRDQRHQDSDTKQADDQHHRA